MRKIRISRKIIAGLMLGCVCIAAVGGFLMREAESGTQGSGNGNTDDAKDVEAFTFSSTGLPVLHVTIGHDVSLDTVNAGSKNVKYSDSIVDLYTDGDPAAEPDSYTEVVFKGRGNASWRANKRSYQIKFSEKVSLFGMKQAEKYLLIANYCDDAVIRNAMTYDIASSLGLAWTGYQFVDFYVNGEYIGNYMICQKPDGESNSVDLANEDGVLVELDYRARSEIGTSEYTVRSFYSGIFVRLRDSGSEEVSKRAAMDSFMESYEALEKATKEKDWERVKSLIDVESFVRYYLLSEWSMNPDAQKTSCFLYKDGAGDVIHAGPVWDYDRAYDNYTKNFSYYISDKVAWVYLDDAAQMCDSYPYMEIAPGYHLYTDLAHIPEFRALACEEWNTVKSTINTFLEDKFDTLVSTIRPSVERDHALWGNQDFDAAVGSLRDCIEERIRLMDLWYGNTIDLENGDYRITTAYGNVLYADETGVRAEETIDQTGVEAIWTVRKEANGYYSIWNGVTKGALGQDKGMQKLTKLGLGVQAASSDTERYVNLWSFIDAGDGRVFLMNMATYNMLEIGEDQVSVCCDYAKETDNKAFTFTPASGDE